MAKVTTTTETATHRSRPSSWREAATTAVARCPGKRSNRVGWTQQPIITTSAMMMMIMMMMILVTLLFVNGQTEPTLTGCVNSPVYKRCWSDTMLQREARCRPPASTGEGQKEYYACMCATARDLQGCLAQCGDAPETAGMIVVYQAEEKANCNAADAFESASSSASKTKSSTSSSSSTSRSSSTSTQHPTPTPTGSHEPTPTPSASAPDDETLAGANGAMGHRTPSLLALPLRFAEGMDGVTSSASSWWTMFVHGLGAIVLAMA